MNIIYYDIKRNLEFEKEYGATFKESVDDVMREADFVSVHVPLLDSTKHLINKERLAMMKPTAYLINTSRGGLVDTEALVKLLDNGKLAGAGLDVLEEETFVQEEIGLLFERPSEKQRRVLANHILLRMSHVIVTPHIAFYSREAEWARHRKWRRHAVPLR
ncbi:hypothetical protein IID62_06215, partial [candidate division KSB1 bacterium]|nr:hypothetical protein [candidate division KSB1 bacterium]